MQFRFMRCGAVHGYYEACDCLRTGSGPVQRDLYLYRVRREQLRELRPPVHDRRVLLLRQLHEPSDHRELWSLRKHLWQRTGLLRQEMCRYIFRQAELRLVRSPVPGILRLRERRVC